MKIIEYIKENQLVVPVVATLAVLSLVFSILSQGTKAHREKLKTQTEEQITAARFLAKITYIKDPRTGVCFAQYNTGNGVGQHDVLTAVPCDGIPTNMLIVPNMGTNSITAITTIAK